MSRGNVQQPYTFLLSGGLNVVTPSLGLPPGACIAAFNYECDPRGYRREAGYERFDGGSLSSEQTYWTLDFTSGSAAIAVGATVTGQTSGATGVVLLAAVLASGSYGGGDAAGYLILTNVVGDFVAAENIRVGGVTKAIAVGEAEIEGVSDDTISRDYRFEAWEYRRTLVQKPAGSGPIRGIFKLGGSIYAIRDNAGATAAALHKATGAGWVAQSLGEILFIDGGTVAGFAEGAVVTAASGGTGTIARSAILSGTFAGSNAAGFLILTGTAGAFTDNAAITASGGGTAVINGTLVNQALPAGGRYQFKRNNFYGAASSERVYGVNGVGRGFEWDGTTFAPIYTGLSDALDKPIRVSERKNHLFLAFANGQITYSSIGEPLLYRTDGGAGTLGFGVEITDLIDAASTALIIYGQRKIGYITGNDATDFALEVLTTESGALAWTAQQVTEPIFLDSGGIKSLSAVNTFGGWALGSKTEAVDPLFVAKANAGIIPVASVPVPSRGQYRIYFSDGSGISIFFGLKIPGSMPFTTDFVVSCAWQDVGPHGESEVWCGGDSGFVYKMFSGINFDGGEVNALIRLPFNSLKSPGYDKRFYGATVEVDSVDPVTVGFASEFSYGNAETVEANVPMAFPSTGGIWDISNWDQFYWDGPFQGQASAPTPGIGENISLIFASSSDRESPHALSAATIRWSMRKLLRRA